MTRAFFAFLAGFLFLLQTPLYAAETPPPAVAFAQGNLQIRTPNGLIPFTIEVAETQAQKEYGFMHRTKIPGDHGMLFLWPNDTMVTMWMKDTPLPLDMLFIDAQGKVVYIAANAVPNSLTQLTAGRPVRAVLELLGDTAELRGIAAGDQVLSPYFPVPVPNLTVSPQ